MKEISHISNSHLVQSIPHMISRKHITTHSNIIENVWKQHQIFTNHTYNLETVTYNHEAIFDNHGDRLMEIIDVYKYTKFKAGSVFREIPMITDQTMATILLIDSNSMTTDLNHPQKDRIYYVVRGKGEVTIDKDSKLVKEGEMILIPKGSSHKYTTTTDRLTLISINQIDDVKTPIPV